MSPRAAAIVSADGSRGRCQVLDLSPTGVRILLFGDLGVRRGQLVRVELNVGGRDIDLPCAVVRTQSREHGTLEVAAEIRLDLARQSCRMQYASWIVAVIRGVQR